MPIVYKVVDLKRRNVAAWWKQDKRYIRIYKKGKIVKACKNSLGIFCFDTKENAASFAYAGLPNRLILKVSSIGESSKPVIIATVTSEKIKNFYKNRLDCNTTIVPNGTVCYPMVEVLD